MRKIGLVVGLLLCASYGGRAGAKRSAPATRGQAMADCFASPTYTVYGKECRRLISTAEAAFVARNWHPKDGSFDLCAQRQIRKGWEITCSYLDNIDKDPGFRLYLRRREGEEEKREEAERKPGEKERLLRELCKRKWEDYALPIAHGFSTAPHHLVYDLPTVQVPRPWGLQGYFDQTLANAAGMLGQPANAEKQLGTYMRLVYLRRLGTDENRPRQCSTYYTFDPSGFKPEIAARLEELVAQSTVLLEARAAEIQRQEDEIRRQQERERKLDEAHDRKVFAAIKRAGAKDDTYYLGLSENVVEEGMSKVRGRAAFLDGYDGGFALIQVLSGGRAIFSGSFPFTVMVVGIKTANLMHDTALTDIGVHWVKVLGFENYTNVPGGQSQAVRVKPLRKIPHPERGQKLE